MVEAGRGALTIGPVTTPEDSAAAVALVEEFFGVLRQRNPLLADEITAYMAHQDIEGEMAALAAGRAEPGRACLVARLDGRPVGTLMLKPITATTCEMNRMYVREEARGRGIGRKLVQELFAVARGLGYTRMRLSSLDTNYEAVPLYRSLGFEDDPDPDPFDLERDFVVSLIRDL